MSQSDKLFMLIKTMGGAEKGYFKKFSRLNQPSESKSYIKLFDAICDQKEYNEEKLKSLENSPAWKKNFSFTKNYLYSQILKAMRSYQNNGGGDFNAAGAIMDYNFLIQKGLYQQAYKLFKKAKASTFEHEKFAFMLYWLFQERYVGPLSTENTKQIKPELEQNAKEVKRFLTLLENYLSSMLLNDELIPLMLKGEANDAADNAKIENMLQRSILSSKDNFLTEKAVLNYYHCRIAMFYSLKQYDKAYHETLEYEKLLSEGLKAGKEYERYYLICMSNVMELELILKNYKTLEKSSNKFSNYLFKDLNSEVYKNERILYAKCVLYYETQQWEKAVKVADETKVYFDENFDQIRKQSIVECYFYLARIYFNKGLYKKALPCINEVLNIKDSDARSDIQDQTQILNLLLHFELNNEDLVESLIRSLSKKLKLSAIERKLFDTISAIIDNKQEVTPLKQLVGLIESEEVSNVGQDIYYWAKNKLLHIKAK